MCIAHFVQSVGASERFCPVEEETDYLNHRIRMFVLIWMTLLFADTAASPGGREPCQNGSCVILNKTQITAEAGLCVVIPCYFTTEAGFTEESAVWYKCDLSKLNCADSDIVLHLNDTNVNAQSVFKGQVSLFESDVSRNSCSIIITDLTKSDSGSYQLKTTGLNGTMEGYAPPIVNITVQDLIQKPTVMIPPLTEGQQTTLTCTAPGLCSGSDPKITWTWRGAGEKDSHITGNITDIKTENVTAVTQRHSSTLTFNPSAEHHGTKVTCKVSFTGDTTTEETVTLNVTYIKNLTITGTTATNIEEGDTLNLTCSVESFPPALITWTKPGSDQSLPKSHLIISSVTAGHSGQYNCTAKHLNSSLTTSINIRVKFKDPKILNSSGCQNKSEGLVCVCISEGFPLPTIKWPLLENHTEYSVFTTASSHTVNSTILLTVKDHSNTAIECVSSNKNGEAKQNLTTSKVEEEEKKEKEGQILKFLRTVTQLENIIAFLFGVVLAVIFGCLVRKCHRKKPKTYGSLTETLEMVTSHEHPVIDAGQAVEDDQAIDQEAAEAGGAAAAGKPDVEYSDLDFSKVKRQNQAEAETTEGAAETEYAEIKKGEAGEGHDGEGKEEEEMIGEDEETKQCVDDETEGEDVALYSNVKDIMDQI